MSKLAILGGEKAVKTEKPHFIWPVIGKEEIDAVNEQMSNGSISINDSSGIVKELEQNFAQYHDMKYALTVNNGTAALYSAYFSCNIGEGDEVIVPAYTFMATVTPLLHLNAIPVLCDGSPETGNILPTEILKKITNKTKAIVVTHMWGHPCEMDEIVQIAKKYNLYLIEDCSHAHGSTYKGHKVGTFGDISCFSLQGKKIVYAGEGGMLLTNSQKIYERAVLVGHYRKRTKDDVHSDFLNCFSKTGYGLKFRMHPLAAAIANTSFKKLDERIEIRRQNLVYFSDLISNLQGLRAPTTYDYVTRGAWYGYKPLYLSEELEGMSYDIFLKAVQAEGVQIHEPGSPPLNHYKIFQDYSEECHEQYYDEWPCKSYYGKNSYKYKIGDFPNVEAFYNRSLSLPTFTCVSDKQIIEEYAAAFHKVITHYKELILLEGKV